MAQLRYKYYENNAQMLRSDHPGIIDLFRNVILSKVPGEYVDPKIIAIFMIRLNRSMN